MESDFVAPFSRPSGSRWALVLAGGEGRRMREFVEALTGDQRPKQYCAFMGERTMVQMALDRALKLVNANHLVTVIGNGHMDWFTDAVDQDLPGTVIEQPADQGTGAAVLAGLSFILEQDPEATIVVLPSDQYIYPLERAIQYLRCAFALAEAFPQQLVLLGAAPDHPETDYGWIRAADQPVSGFKGPSRYQARPIRQFIEKPELDEALALLKDGAMWNTMLVAGRAQTLWNHFYNAQPVLAQSFAEYRLLLRAGAWPGSRTTSDTGWIDTHRAALKRAYARMEPVDFSAGVLSQLSPGEAMLLPMNDVEWSDWGRPERVYNMMIGLGLNNEPDVRRTLEAARFASHGPVLTS